MRLGSILGDPLDRLGLMLVVAQDGSLMLSKKQQMLDSVVPSVQEYGSAPVYRERTFPLRPTGGYGERVQSSFGDKRYYWGIDIQVDGGLFGKGPQTHPIQPQTAAGGYIAKFIDTPAGTQFILGGTKVYRRVDDTNLQPVDRDMGYQTLDAVVFQGGFSGAASSMYVTIASGVLWERTPSGTWTACATPSGFFPCFLEVVGTELWAADRDASVIRKVTADPKVAGNWSGPYLIGNPATKITALRQSGNSLHIFKDDGRVYTLNSDGSVNDLFPGIKAPTSTENGRTAAAWMGAIWFRAGTSFYRLDVPSENLVAAGPGMMLDNASPVRGDVQCFVGWGGYRAYLCLWNAINSTTYLLSYGNWEPRETEEGTSFIFDNQFDGALAHWGAKATSMGVSGASGNDRLYIGFDNGTWQWIKLVRNPLAADSGAEFVLGPSEIVFPLHHAMFQADLKHWLGFSCFGPVMRPGDEVQLYYRIMASAGAPPTDPSGNWLYLGEFTSNGQRIDTPSNLVGNALSLKAALSNVSTADTPVLEVVAYHERVVPAFKRDIQATINANGYQARLDGAVQRINSDNLHQALLDFAGNPGSLAIELPDETINEIALFGYQESLKAMQAGGGRSWAIDISATQFRILTIYGIVKRLRGTRVRDLQGYTVDSLRAL
jgi:hypothetical protein